MRRNEEEKEKKREENGGREEEQVYKYINNSKGRIHVPKHCIIERASF